MVFAFIAFSANVCLFLMLSYCNNGKFGVDNVNITNSKHLGTDRQEKSFLHWYENNI